MNSEARKRAALSQPVPAPVDSGAIGRLNEAEREALALSLWDAGLVRPESLARAVVDHIDDDGIVREHTDRALAEVEQRIEAEKWQFRRVTGAGPGSPIARAYEDASRIVRAARQERGR